MSSHVEFQLRERITELERENSELKGKLEKMENAFFHRDGFVGQETLKPQSATSSFQQASVCNTSLIYATESYFKKRGQGVAGLRLSG